MRGVWRAGLGRIGLSEKRASAFGGTVAFGAVRPLGEARCAGPDAAHLLVASRGAPYLRISL
ncbi:hypothetical protein Sgou_32890 [Streptomyces gougerotii]|uniref:Uncharacterized protein n=1 Tax=Streptomyces gougerotii TaxID=53448 RepID=A0A8H9HRL2_9ACTN|nr:hypothetical protein Sgou_32890 [Streptomyces gougerotii]GGU85431.1 hypothetical protein GCM10010227_44730 [Streptomyces gougerotii]